MSVVLTLKFPRQYSMMSRIKLFLCLFLLGLCSTVACSEELPVGGDVCRDEQDYLDSLQRQLKRFEGTASQIDAIVKGESTETFTSSELQALLSGAADTVETVVVPASLRCESLQQDYSRVQDAIIWQKQQINRLRKDFWGDQSEVARAAILSVWRSRQRLLKHEKYIHSLINKPESIEVIAAIDALQASLHEQRRVFFHLLPTLRINNIDNNMTPWVELWQQVFSLSEQFFQPQPAMLKVLQPNVRAAIEDHYRIAWLDHLVLSSELNHLRSWLWVSQPALFKQFRLSLKGGDKALLENELLAIRSIIQWLYIDTSVGYRQSGHVESAVVWRFFQGFEYFLGLSAFVLLAWLVHRIKAPCAALQASYARNNRKSRMHRQISRFTSSASVLFPWLLGWLGLSLIAIMFKQYHLVLLMPLIPFARLYIVYSLMRLIGQWLTFRIVQQAGEYLNEQQIKLTETQVRRSARLVILPWLLKDLAVLAIGPSLLVNMLDSLSLIVLFIAIGMLLRPRKREFILSLQSFTPAALDSSVEWVLSRGLFLIFAPLLTPLLLVAILVGFIHKGMVDFDWYRTLMARSFKLRSGAYNGEDIVESEQNAFEQYQHWFVAAADSEEKRPFINVDLQDTLEQSLTPWLEARSEENTLLLSGERGAGKTTVINRLCEKLVDEHENLDIHCIDVPAKTTTVEGVQTLLGAALDIDLSEGAAALVKTDDERRPTIVILENGQNFFLREVGGLSGWETLLSLTHARVNNIFWVIVINNQSWAYLSNVFGKGYQFSAVLKTQPWSQNDIRSLVLSRNQLSGFKISYDSILLSTRGPEAGSIRNAEQLYFSLLWDACRGNPMVAMQMWLSSVTVKSKAVTVGLPAEVNSSVLERCGEELHFVYAALVLHENMTSDELIAATAMPQGVVRSALKTAFDTGFVERSVNRRYRIVPLWFPTITKFLARKNLLHE